MAATSPSLPTAPTVSNSPTRAEPRWGRWSLRVVALVYLTVLLVIPLAVIARAGLSAGLGGLWQAITVPEAAHALFLTLWTSALMALLNAVMGLLTAWVFVRYTFPGKALLSAVVDLPLAIPTLVTGVMLVALYGPQGGVGGWLAQRNIQILFAPPGIILALLFITFPFVVRAVQPVLESLDRELEAAAATLGASPWIVFRRVTLPALALPLLSGALLSFARGVGEFGAIVIVSGNIPFQTETAAVYVYGQVEAPNYQAASAMSIALLAIAFGLVLVVDWLRHRRRSARV